MRVPRGEISTSSDSPSSSLGFGFQQERKMGSDLSICCTLSSNEDESNLLEIQAPPSSPSSIDRCSYGIFSSFRNGDIRKNFNYLLKAVENGPHMKLISLTSWVIKKANNLWRDWKHTLRTDFYDKYTTNAERKRNVPERVKPEDWERFVDMCSTPAIQELRGREKRIREAVKSPHTSGRKGQARVAEEMALIQRLLDVDPSSASRDIDHDPVMGLDSRCYVRGMGMGVSRTSLFVTTPLRQNIAGTQATQSSLSSKVEELGTELQSIKATLALLTGSTGISMHTHTDVGASSQA